jgi:hypothetical protein
MPDPKKILQTIKRATELFRATPGRRGSVVHLDGAAEVMVVGDLHGNVTTFAQVLKVALLDKNPDRHLVLQELVHDPRADESPDGDRSHRLVDLVCALKCQYPSRVHLILGNHELSELTGRSISKNGVMLNTLFREGLAASYRDESEAILQAYMNLFSSLPLMARTPNRVVVCHTVPDERDFENLDLELLERDEWPPDSLLRGGTVYALTWGRDLSQETADRFAQRLDADLFVIGHHPCEEGFTQANHRTLIVDATDPYPAYCIFRANEPATIESLLATTRILPLPT